MILPQLMQCQFGNLVRHFFSLDNIEVNNLVVQADTGTEHLIATLSYTPLLIGV